MALEKAVLPHKVTGKSMERKPRESPARGRGKRDRCFGNRLILYSFRESILQNESGKFHEKFEGFLACQATLADVCEFLEANHLPLAATRSFENRSVNSWRSLSGVIDHLNCGENVKSKIEIMHPTLLSVNL